MHPLITLTTDFGIGGPFVGVMKGVILSLAPSARLVDITHQIEPQNIAQAAWVVEAAYPWFPEKTVHLVVVDPGVGSQRRAIAVKNGTHTFVAPDNGVLTPVLQPGARVYELNRKKYFRDPLSATFHGRDLFAPAAAWLARGTPPSRMGPKITAAVTLKMPQPRLNRGTLTGEVIYIDRFGNLITNISSGLLESAFPTGAGWKIKIAAKPVRQWVSHYSQCRPGDIGCVLNSWDKLEVFCREGNAAQKLKCRVGSPVKITPTRSAA
ncbi:MAG: S-adenosyl-l-methionine hydroxide adenosyltransferase family protein [Nitrospinaceae bacterium]